MSIRFFLLKGFGLSTRGDDHNSGIQHCTVTIVYFTKISGGGLLNFRGSSPRPGYIPVLNTDPVLAEMQN